MYVVACKQKALSLEVALQIMSTTENSFKDTVVLVEYIEKSQMFALEETGDNWEGKCIAEKQTERLELKLSNAEANQIDEKKKKKGEYKTEFL
ncbi:hypothetical protein AtNW77_Chr3g0176611 [Arabidopsis thaliana]